MQEIRVNYHYLDHCDMACKHCFGKMNHMAFNEKQVLSTFLSLCKATKSINLAGGEIFLHIDLLERLTEIAMNYRVNLSLITNGEVLLENLNNPVVEKIIRRVKMIGVSIDSFNKSSNNQTGRVGKQLVLSTNKMVKLRKLCHLYGTILKINTVVSQYNIDECMSAKIEKISPNIWKVIQVHSSDKNTSVTNEAFEAFLKNNKVSCKTKIEYNSNIQKSYVMFNAEGSLYYDGQHQSFNINNFLEKYKMPARYLLKELKELDIDISSYYDRYNFSKDEILFNKKKYSKILGKHIKSKGNVLLLDVESYTFDSKRNKAYFKYTNTQLHFLYCGLVVNENMDIVERFSDQVEIDAFTTKQIDKIKTQPIAFKNFYEKFVVRLKEHKIKKIIVSNKDTERNFFQDCIYYCENLTRRDYEMLQKLFNNLIDIQMVKLKDVIANRSPKTASRAILDLLHQWKSDIFLYTRPSRKAIDTSMNISEILAEVYLNNTPYFEAETLMAEVRRHCYQDVIDDYELMYAYELLNKSTIDFT